MNQKNHKAGSSFFVRFFLVIFGVITPIVFFEAGLRVDQYFRKGIPLTLNPSYRWDDQLGWLGKEHVLGNSSANPILVLGDSFTDGLNVPSEKMWFASLASAFPDKKVIAYGGLGYGNLQELLVLKNYLAKGVSPSLIVLQLCSNDIINNYFPLEQHSYLQRAAAPRPYLEGDKIVTRLPRRSDWILFPLISISRLAYRYNNKWDETLANWAKDHKIDSVEFKVQSSGFKFPLFREAVTVTDRIIYQIKETSKTSPLLFMLIDDIEPYTAAFKTIAQKHEIPLLIPSRISPIPDNGRLADGSHLNELGNKLIGDTFVDLARKEQLFLQPL